MWPPVAGWTAVVIRGAAELHSNMTPLPTATPLSYFTTEPHIQPSVACRRGLRSAPKHTGFGGKLGRMKTCEFASEIQRIPTSVGAILQLRCPVSAPLALAMQGADNCTDHRCGGICVATKRDSRLNRAPWIHSVAADAPEDTRHHVHAGDLKPHPTARATFASDEVSHHSKLVAAIDEACDRGSCGCDDPSHRSSRAIRGELGEKPASVEGAGRTTQGILHRARLNDGKVQCFGVPVAGTDRRLDRRPQRARVGISVGDGERRDPHCTTIRK
mmetsp:Transcript_59757/g.133127  ORF Transcript_59757/g.133127 Transcript_59757/m.133127 type:complete len:273 (-) Transcript_59757:599-1417(-)